MASTLYPTSPNLKNRKLTNLTGSYKLRATLAVVAIVLFFVLYFALVYGLARLVHYSIVYEITRVHKFSILMKVGAVAGSVMLFVFTLKFIFKLKKHKRENRIKLSKKEHAELWNFVYQICKETGTPKPKAIYVDPDVNAYVSYENMWLSLFFPARKELTIGMGLVDCLNLNEFKAVISHEFGHFAQRSMKIGSYIISANTIIHDMIFERDRWDNWLEQWRGSDIRISFAAWIITPIIWIIRQVLALFYQFLNIMYSSLSREMEFNADKVAVTTSGSDAIVAALWKLDDGATQWNSTLNHAYLASLKNIYTKNLYDHNSLALDRNLPYQLEKFEKLPEDPRGGKLFFESSETSKVHMYASHPPNNLREDNAKKPYISCPNDERSPWLLFENKEAIQEQMTQLVYAQYLKQNPQEFNQAEVFESFIQQEAKGKGLQDTYMNTFENRFLNIPEVSKINKTIPVPNIEGTVETKIAHLKEELPKLMRPIQDIEKLMEKAVAISNKTIPEKTLQFMGKTYPRKKMGEAYDLLNQEREKLFRDSFVEWDHKFITYHLALAAQKGKEDTLQKMYLQHKVIGAIYKGVVDTKSEILRGVSRLQAKSEVTQTEVSQLERSIKSQVKDMNGYLNL